MDAITVTVPLPLDETEARVRDALGTQGFGVLTEIDVAATLKAKLDVDRPALKILGACNPTLAHRALEIDESVALLLPCNVTLVRRRRGDPHRRRRPDGAHGRRRLHRPGRRCPEQTRGRTRNRGRGPAVIEEAPANTIVRPSEPPPNAARALAGMGSCYWAAALLTGAVAYVAIAVPTALIVTPVFGRSIAPRPIDHVVAITSALLIGMIWAARRQPVEDGPADVPLDDGDQVARRRSLLAGLVAGLAVGCPVCNKVVILAPGNERRPQLVGTDPAPAGGGRAGHAGPGAALPAPSRGLGELRPPDLSDAQPA